MVNDTFFYRPAKISTVECPYSLFFFFLKKKAKAKNFVKQVLSFVKQVFSDWSLQIPALREEM